MDFYVIPSCFMTVERNGRFIIFKTMGAEIKFPSEDLSYLILILRELDMEDK